MDVKMVEMEIESSDLSDSSGSSLDRPSALP